MRMDTAEKTTVTVIPTGAALGADIVGAIVGMQCKHDASRNSAGELRRGFKEVTDPREAPGAVHPLVRTHPTTRRNALFLGRRRNAYIVGLPLDESEDLLNRLWAHAGNPARSPGTRIGWWATC
jgi:taurine dioxygenase